MSSAKPNVLIHLHTLDLRIHDLSSLFRAHDPSSKLSSRITHYLPLYVFDERQLDLSSLPNAGPAPANRSSEQTAKQHGHPHADQPTRTRNAPLSRVSGFHRTSPYRLLFLLESVFGLREAYRRSGGDLLIGYGKPEVIVPELVKYLQNKQHDVAGVHAQNEVSLEEVNMHQQLRAALDKLDGSVDLHLEDSKTLIPADKLPFDPKRGTPDIYTSFRKKVEGLGVHLGGMLLEPLKTAVWETDDKGTKELRVSVGKGGAKLKPIPDLADLTLPNVAGGVLKKGDDLDSVERMYAKLSAPLVANPPLGGWTSFAKGESLPELNPNGACPFKGDEESALSRLEDYVGHPAEQNWVGGGKAKRYKATRNGLMGEAFSTKFSAFFSLGSLSAREAGWRVGQLLEHVGRDKEKRDNVYWIIFELLWRDYFQFATLHYSQGAKASQNPSHPNSSLFDPSGFSSQMSNFPQNERPDVNAWHSPNWDDPEDPAVRWCLGKTGVPFIDANMREIRETGWMSNRGRQNVASFLVKDLYVDWRIGAEFFEMHLIDYDTCSNWGNWQYQAGVGNDPRSSRTFNPIKQASDYDKEGKYVRLWLDELKDVPDHLLQTPWLSNKQYADYPLKPIVESPTWRKHYKTRAGHANAQGNGYGGGDGGGNGHRRNPGPHNGQGQGQGRGQGQNQGQDQWRGNDSNRGGRGGGTRRGGGGGGGGGRPNKFKPGPAGLNDVENL